jgi:hypothetical protein
MITPFSSTANGTVSAATFAAAVVYARSTATEGTSRTLTLSGLADDSTPTSGAVTITASQGRVETVGIEFTQLTSGNLSGTCAGDVKIYTPGTAGVGLMYLTGQPSDGDTVTIGLVGFTQVYRFKTTTAAAYDVKIGATANDTATNLKKALNADGLGDGTDYHAGTLINAYLSASVSGAIVTVTDRIQCARQLGWSFLKSGTNISVSAPIGGVDGTLLATISAGQTAVYNAFSLDDEALTANFLPGLVNWTSDPVRVSGKRFSLHISSGNVTTGMVTSYQYSTQTTPTVWRAGLTSISNLDDNAQVITPTEVVEHVRLKINNTNTAAASVNAKLVSA